MEVTTVIVGVILFLVYQIIDESKKKAKKKNKFNDVNITFKNGIGFEKKHYPQEQYDDDYVSRIIEPTKGEKDETDHNNKEGKEHLHG